MQNNGLINETFYSERDYDYEVVCGAIESNKYPSYFKLPEESTGTQKDQKNIGSCVAMTISSIAEAYWNKTLDVNQEHSEGYVYGRLRADSSKGSGMIVSNALEKWTKIGTVPKHYFDILVEMPEMKTQVDKHKTELDAIAKKYRLSGFVRLRDNATSTRDEQIKDALLKYGYGLVMTDSAHCTQLVGWDDEKDIYIYKDSYGSDAGDNGYKNKKKASVDQVWLPIFEPIKLPFEDVKETDWFYKDVQNIYLSGIMKGTSETTFSPNKNLTRAEAAVLMNRIRKENEEMMKILNKILQEKQALKEEGIVVL